MNNPASKALTASSQARRKRVVVLKPSHDYCKTCRARKTKCDGTRPCCMRCTRSGLVCQGYSSWELDFTPPTDKAVVIRSTRPVTTAEPRAFECDQLVQWMLEDRVASPVSGRAANRTQLLAKYLEDRFPDPTPAAPAIGHMARTSLPHLWASMNLSTPLIRYAIESICLTHLAGRSKQSDAIALASRSRGQILAMLHHAVATHDSDKPIESSQTIIMVIMLISIMPAIPGDSEVFLRQSAVHLEGAIQFMAKYGPAVLGSGRTEMNDVLLRQLQFQANVVSIARRQEMIFEKPSWAKVPRMLLNEDTAIYQVTGWLPPKTEKRVEWWHAQPGSLERIPTAVPERNIPRDLFGSLPGLCRMADEFVAEEGTVTPERLEDLASLVRHTNFIQKYCIRAAVYDSEAAACGPMIRNTHLDSFDMSLEEHRYLLRTSFVREHYQFKSPQYGFNSAITRHGSLNNDCALLKIICRGMDYHGLAADWTGVSKAEVEHRAYLSAYESCQHVHFYSQRPLTAVKFLYAFVYTARSFFHSAGVEEETRWCDGCLEAISVHVRRLETVHSSLCPMVETFYKTSEGSRYDSAVNKPSTDPLPYCRP